MPDWSEITLEISVKSMRGTARFIPGKGREIRRPQGEEEARRGMRTRDGVAGFSAENTLKDDER
jgi:hypothetical protein